MRTYPEEELFELILRGRRGSRDEVDQTTMLTEAPPLSAVLVRIKIVGFRLTKYSLRGASTNLEVDQQCSSSAKHLVSLVSHYVFYCVYAVGKGYCLVGVLPLTKGERIPKLVVFLQ